MIKNILVALDPDQDTPVATRYAAEIAERSSAKVIGLAVIDTHRIAAELGPGGAVGATHYIETSRKRMLDEAREKARALVKNFDETLHVAVVAHEEQVQEGAVVEQLLEELKYSDLLIIGRTPHFFYNRPDRATNTLARVVKHSIVPSLVVGEEFAAVDHVLIAYDGSAASARTMHGFAQLQPFGKDLTVEVVHVRTGESSRQREATDLLLQRASRYLEEHGFERIRRSGLEGVNQAAALIEHAGRVEASLIVAGAHSVSAIRRAAFGSTTHELLTTCTVPLFIFH